MEVLEQLASLPALRRGIEALLAGDDSHGMAERSLICSMLLCPILVPVVERTVKAEDFGERARRVVATEMMKQGDSSTLHSVAEALGGRGAGGMGSGEWNVALSAFLDWAVADDDIDGLCKSVIEGSIKRRKEARGTSKAP